MEKHTKNGIKCWNLGFFQQRFLYLCLVFLLVSMTSVWAGNTIETTFANVKTLKGTVVDSKGEPLIGATVLVQGTTLGTITDVEGKFSVQASVGATLEFSYLGYSTVIYKVKTLGDIFITMTEDVHMVEEVVVVGYGVQKKETVTGAISSVNTKALVQSSQANISNALVGRLPGLTAVQKSGEPGNDQSIIRIRGIGSFAGSYDSDLQNPLVMVDGIEVANYNNIDPNEIENVAILKDASATAVFGVRGANGVILITTKRGKEGKARISFTTSASILAPTKLVEQANSYEYATFYNAMNRNDGASPVFSDAVIQKFQDGTDPIRFPSIKWTDYIMGDATLQSQHNVNISGGTDKVRYFISAGAYTQGGLFNEFNLPYNISYQYRRFNYRSNLDMDVTKTTTISFNVAGNVNTSDKPRTSQGSSGMVKNIYYSTPFRSAGFVDNKLVYSTADTHDDGLKLPFVGDIDPFTYYGSGATQTNNNSLNADLILNQNLDFLTKGLSFRLKGSYNSSFTVYKYMSGGTEMTYNPVLVDEGNVGLRPVDNSKYTDVSYTSGTGKSRDWYMEAGFNYNRSFGGHTVGGLLLYNQSKSYYPSTYSDIPKGYVGLVGRITYDWMNRYMAEFNVGYNGSENFAPDKRFSAFPAGSVGWLMSEEKFFQPLKSVVSFLKLRASFGLVGNDKPDRNAARFMYLADPYSVNLDKVIDRIYASGEAADAWGYLFGITSNTVTNGAREVSKNNPDVTWEKAFKRNYGIDINFFDDRLSATAEYYREHRWDILLRDGTAPGMLGFLTPYANLGEVNSWGWELSLKWNDKIGKNFRYWATMNLSYNQNKIIERKEAPQDNDYQYGKNHRIGSRSQYVFWRYYDESTPELYEKTFNRPFPTHSVVLENGDAVYVDLNGDRKIDANDMSYDYGFTDDPEYMIGLNLGFSWKNWEVNTQWTGAWNVSRMISDVFRQPFVSSAGSNAGGLLSYHLDHTWTPENPSQSAEYPRATQVNASNNYATSTLFEKDAKYLRLKTLQVAYNFQFPLMKKLGLTTCQLAFSGYNLLTFSPYLWGDPEATASNAPTYPLTKTYTLSLKLGF